LAYDRDIKLSSYARASAPAVWIINIQDKCIQTHSDPADDGYRQKAIRRKGEVARLAVLPLIELDVTALFACRESLHTNGPFSLRERFWV